MATFYSRLGRERIEAEKQAKQQQDELKRKAAMASTRPAGSAQEELKRKADQVKQKAFGSLERTCMTFSFQKRM